MARYSRVRRALSLGSAMALMLLTLAPAAHAVGIPPVAGTDAYSTNEDTLLSVAAPGVLSNDTPSSGLTATLVTPPAHSKTAFTLNPDGSFSYTPAVCTPVPAVRR